MSSNINGPQDLDEKRVGVVKGSTSEEYMAREHRAILEGYASSKELFSHLEEGGLDAIVNDLPTLHYYANTEGKGKVKIVGKMFKKQHYAFLYPEDSILEEPVNRTLLRLFENGTISAIQRKWFGELGDG
jgi:ABC-type amino acid transport substrate-binding protein